MIARNLATLAYAALAGIVLAVLLWAVLMLSAFGGVQ